MRLIRGFRELPVQPPRVAAIGNFDGAHLGHQAIFARVRERARATGLPAAVITFDPHPLQVLAPERAPKMILTGAQKIEILEQAGFDTLVLIPFDRSIAAVPAEEFVRAFLVQVLSLRELYVGVDFRFGRGRAGDLALLQRVGGPAGLTVESVPTGSHAGERISASRLREALAAGDVAGAAAMMGRPYEAVGTVVRGAGRGKKQGSPTANLEVENGIVPANGVYITDLQVCSAGQPGQDGGLPPAEGAAHEGLTNVGVRPTFESAGFAVETWLPGWSGDLYGRLVRLRFHERIRSEQAFPSPDALRARIALDLEALRAWQARGR